MNERIKLLADQAEDYATAEYEKWIPTPDFSGIPNVRKIFNEKFSELLIRECVGVVNANMDDILDQPVFNPTDELWNRARVEELVRVALHIKKHFGVEE